MVGAEFPFAQLVHHGVIARRYVLPEIVRHEHWFVRFGQDRLTHGEGITSMIDGARL
jgi:hypothetical protein